MIAGTANVTPKFGYFPNSSLHTWCSSERVNRTKSRNVYMSGNEQGKCKGRISSVHVIKSYRKVEFWLQSFLISNQIFFKLMLRPLYFRTDSPPIVTIRRSLCGLEKVWMLWRRSSLLCSCQEFNHDFWLSDRCIVNIQTALSHLWKEKFRT
jgi:hypothetical protein